jgi:hypothetical protein
VAIPAAPEGVVRVEVVGDVVGTLWANVFHLNTEVSGPPTEADVGTLIQAFYNAYLANLLPHFNNGWLANYASGSYSNGDGTFVEGSYANAVAGEDSGVYLDAGASLLISWRVSASWRGGHPRTYLPGITQDRLQTATAFSTATITEYQGAVDDFLAAVNALTPAVFTSVTLGCLRRFADGGSTQTPPVYLDPPEFVPFASGLCRKQVAHQRRRISN